MTKEEFEKKHKLLEGYMLNSPDKYLDAYMFLRKDYVKQLKIIKELEIMLKNHIDNPLNDELKSFASKVLSDLERLKEN